jgi:hypothetical protein
MRVGLLGLGRIGAFHAATLAAHPPADELIVADPVRTSRYGRPGDPSEPDAVVIATPTGTDAGAPIGAIPPRLDAGHLRTGDTDPADLVRAAASRIAHVHLKDVDARVAMEKDVILFGRDERPVEEARQGLAYRDGVLGVD